MSAVGECVTHHYACECRDAQFRHVVREARILITLVRQGGIRPDVTADLLEQAILPFWPTDWPNVPAPLAVEAEKEAV